MLWFRRGQMAWGNWTDLSWLVRVADAAGREVLSVKGILYHHWEWCTPSRYCHGHPQIPADSPKISGWLRSRLTDSYIRLPHQLHVVCCWIGDLVVSAGGNIFADHCYVAFLSVCVDLHALKRFTSHHNLQIDTSIFTVLYINKTSNMYWCRKIKSLQKWYANVLCLLRKG